MHKNQRMCYVFIDYTWKRKKGGAKNQIRNGSFSLLHVYFHLGKNPPLSTSLLNSKSRFTCTQEILVSYFLLEKLRKDQSFNPLLSKALGSDSKTLDFDFICPTWDVYVNSSFTRTLPNMENFAFGNLTHHKGLVPESAELQFIDKLCFQTLIRIHFAN